MGFVRFYLEVIRRSVWSAWGCADLSLGFVLLVFNFVAKKVAGRLGLSGEFVDMLIWDIPFVVFLAVVAIGFVWNNYRLYREEYQAKLRAQDELAAKTRAALDILPETEVDKTTGYCRVLVKNHSPTSCKFGVMLEKLEPRVPGVPVPLPLQLTHENGQSTAALPGEGSRLVDVFCVTTMSLLDKGPAPLLVAQVAGVGQLLDIPRARYRVTLCAHTEQGLPARRDFIFDSCGGIVAFAPS